MQMVPSGTNMEDNLALSMPIVVKKNKKSKHKKPEFLLLLYPVIVL